MNENKTLNDYCIDFQQKIIDLFNNEQNLPFVLKYYLVKDVWENVQSTKTKMDIDTRSKMKVPDIIQTLDLETGQTTTKEVYDNNEETEEM